MNARYGCLGGLLVGAIASGATGAASFAVAVGLVVAADSPDPAPVVADVVVDVAVATEPPPPVFVGVVLPLESVDVVAPFDARVAALAVEMGDLVTRGQPVAVFDVEALGERVVAARAEASASASAVGKAALDLEQAVHDHQQLELARDAVAASEIVDADYARRRAEAALREARARNAADRAKLAEIDAGLGEGQVSAPIDGVVAGTLVSAGAVVRQGEPIVRIASGALGVRFAIEPEALGAVEVGDVVAVTVPVTRVQVPAQIVRISPWVDAASGVILAEATLAVPADDRARVVAGMVAEVTTEDGGA